MTKINRRSFLGTAAGTVAMSRLAYSAANEKKLKFGLIGCGWYGMVDTNAALDVGGVEVAALCDVDSEHLEKSAAEVEKKQGSRPKTYKQYQELLDQGGMDFVIVATPPHWHALPFIAACEKGLPVYCEKPLAYDIREGRAMAQAARQAGNIVQIGFQRRQSNAVQEAMKFIRDGNIGPIVQVEAQIHYSAGGEEYTPQDPPASLDWDLWCGPAPKLPYSPNIGHFNWRLEQEYGNGHLVDWGIHWIDSVRMILGLKTPTTVTASGGLYRLKKKITTPDILSVHFEFEECPVFWRHRIWGAAEYTPETSNGVFFYGEKGTVFMADNQWTLMPKGKEAQPQVNKPSAENNAGKDHMAEFLQAVRENKQPSCLIEDAFQSTATVQLGMIAYHTGRTVRWDAPSEQIVEDPEAAKRLKRDYRAPWKHPYQGA